MDQKILDLDCAAVASKIQAFISDKTTNSGSSGVVIGVSGGIDSSVVLALSVKALTPHRVLGLLMPRKDITPPQDVKDGEQLASDLGVEYRIIDIDEICAAFMDRLIPGRIPEGNLAARVRMSLLYYHANLMDRLVVGTGDKSEELIGYFTKFGDGGVDILPIGDLYKTQVIRLARWIGLPESLVEKPSSPRLWKDHLAQEEIGVSYEMIDRILFGIVEGSIPNILADNLGIQVDLVRQIQRMVDQSKHKRSIPDVCRVT